MDQLFVCWWLSAFGLKVTVKLGIGRDDKGDSIKLIFKKKKKKLKMQRKGRYFLLIFTKDPPAADIVRNDAVVGDSFRLAIGAQCTFQCEESRDKIQDVVGTVVATGMYEKSYASLQLLLNFSISLFIVPRQMVESRCSLPSRSEEGYDCPQCKC